MRRPSRPPIHLSLLSLPLILPLIALGATGVFLANAVWGEDLRHPFGVMLDGSGLDTPTRIATARELGVGIFRPWDIILDEWTGRHGDTEAFLKAGFTIIMTVRNNGKGGPPPKPTSPPKDLDAYKKTLGEVIETYRPELLVVEHEGRGALTPPPSAPPTSW